jgi:tryptophan 2,3-dioxygenase
MENCLGLRSQQRLSYGGRTGYCSVLSAEDAAAVADSEQPPSLFQLMEEWLERTPFLEFQAEQPQGSAGSTASTASTGSSPPSSPPLFTFWGHYRTAVEAMLEADGMLMRANSSAFTPAALEAHARDLAAQRAHFDSLLDPAMYAASLERGERRLSHRATQAALMITLFQREPGFAQPYRFLQALLSIDEALCAWRARHAQMVHRMLGAKVGTGGSSGYSYLKATVDRHRIFTDLFNLSTFLIPEAMLPPLPPELTQRLGFNFPPSSAAAPRAAARAAAAGAAAAAPHPVPQVGTPPGVCPFGHSSN